MDLPDEKGTYILIAFVARTKRIEIGRLGRFDIIPGNYAYVGTALVPEDFPAAAGFAAPPLDNVIHHLLPGYIQMPEGLDVLRNARSLEL